MSESNLSITFNACQDAFKSKNSRKRMKEELKKSFNLLENKDDFLLIPNDKTGYFTKFLNDICKFTIEKTDEYKYTVTITQDEEKVNKQKEENDKEMKRKMLKDKLNSLKDRRSNVTGRRIKDMRKNMGDDLVKKFMQAQSSLGNNKIPDPDTKPPIEPIIIASVGST